ncbi:MAG: hypothetical protein Q9160_003262 [Pyrenula sp. 1 TL-2023]
MQATTVPFLARSNGVDPIDEEARGDGGRPAKRQCLSPPRESMSEPRRERSGSETDKIDHGAEAHVSPAPQNPREHDVVENQLSTIPGLGSIADHEESIEVGANEGISTTTTHAALDAISTETLDGTAEPNIGSEALSEHQSTTEPATSDPEQTGNLTDRNTQYNVANGVALSDRDTSLNNVPETSHLQIETNLDEPSIASDLKHSPAPAMEDGSKHNGDLEAVPHGPHFGMEEGSNDVMPSINDGPENIDGPSTLNERTSAPAQDANTELEMPKSSVDATTADKPNGPVQKSGIVTGVADGLTSASTEGHNEMILPNVEGPSMMNINPHLDAIEASMNDEGAEWEIDSSPIESSSDSDTSSDSDSDDDSNDDDDENGGEDYALLAPEEQARILMRDEGGSDDEGGGKKDGKSTGAQLRTLNERPEEIIPKPNVTITPEMKIEELGKVECIVEDTVVVKGKTSGEYRVLETGSLLCLEDRSVIGVVAETMGRVQQPMYTVRFTNTAAIEEAGLSASGTSVYFVEDHSSFVFTYPLRLARGTDASNFHDEEVGEDEMEFSDDEKEAEHKRQLKLQRQAKKGQRQDTKGPRRGSGRPSTSRNGDTWDVPPTAVGEISYDDMETSNDGYTPLQRPGNYQDMVNGAAETFDDLPANQPRPTSRDHKSNRGRGRGGRGERGGGRGRGDDRREGRGAGRGAHRRGSFPPARQHSTPSNMGPPPPLYSHQQNGGHQSYGNPPPQWQHSPSQQYYPPSFPLPPNGSQIPPPPSLTPQSPAIPFSPSPISPLPTQSFGFPNSNPYPQQHQHQQPPPPPQQQMQNPQMPPAGSFVNPAFFNMARPNQGVPPSGPYGTGNGAGNAESYRQVNELLASLNSRNQQQGGPRYS